MKTVLVSLVWSIVRQLIGAGIGDQLLRLVREAADLPGMNGADRKEWVRHHLNELGRIGMIAIVNVAESLLNLGIEAAVQKSRLGG